MSSLEMESLLLESSSLSSSLAWYIMSKEEVVEDIVGANIIEVSLVCAALCSTSRFCSFICFFRSSLIINSLLLGITQACNCSIDLFKSLCGLRCWVFVWMTFNSQFLVCFLHSWLISIFCHPKHLVIIFLFNNSITNVYLFLGV